MSTFLIVLLVVVGLMLAWMIFWGLFWFLVQAGVIVQAAAKPPITDTSDYSITQGKEVKTEEQQGS